MCNPLFDYSRIVATFCNSGCNNSSVFALLAFKRAIFEDPLSRLSDWNTRDKDPCKWSGVWCSPFNSRVVTLDLSNSSLEGFLVPQIGSLRSLQKLKLDDNILMGSIPEEIGMLKNLTELDLGANQLTGPIPSEIGDMTKIKKIDLHGNRLNGAIPSELGKLANLVELRLSNNSLTGIIPASNDSNMESANSIDQIGLCQLSQLTDIDLSYNFLVGDIPACLKQIQRSSLVGNCFQNNGTENRLLEQCQNSQGTGNEDPAGGNEKKGLPEPLWLLILEVFAAVTMLCFLTLCTVAGFRRCKARSSGSGTSVPWTRAVSWKENTVISIGQSLLSIKITDFERWRYLVTKPGLGFGGEANGGLVSSVTDSQHKRFMDVQANTFAFGVILLELISGRATVFKDTADLVDWARKHLDQPEEFSKLVDPKLQSVNQESLGIVCNVVNLCIDPEPSRRPSMSMIAAIRLEEGMEKAVGRPHGARQGFVIGLG
ncbi:hypothetical protein PR202_ga19555 [Eleusine coracana subsp. coracana]|uniref:Leucine-rich repeat-containing N-terminal plant-type domain-containing protein n=1 Tax=Eleusine coracana subsp. coracana TaxID=191504 RepID=A0AAV5CVF8_ELECO|nr:hypothetical protein PR202_ga19555 [Eleusine coracana subsp. coracana]